MKKKLFIILLAVTAATVCAAGLSACFGGNNHYIEDGVLKYYVNGDTLAVHECLNGATEIIIPAEVDGKKVTAVNPQAFYEKNVTSVTIPESVTSIGSRAFGYCKNLKSITVDQENPVYVGEGNCIIEKQSGRLVFGCNTSVIPDDGSVNAIAENCFLGSAIKSVCIPDSVTRIGVSAFGECEGLESVYYGGDITEWCAVEFGGFYANPLFYAQEFYIGDGLVLNPEFPDSITYISDYAFGGYSAITRLTIPQGVTKIGDCAFASCENIERVYWNSVECQSAGSADNPVFKDGGKLCELIIGEEVQSLPENAFADCLGLTGVTVPEKISYVGANAFGGCIGLEIVNWNAADCQSAGSKNNSAFGGCKNLGCFNIGEGVKSIPDYALAHTTGIKDITIPDGVEKIGTGAFFGCLALESVEIPDSVIQMGNSAFGNCESLVTAKIGSGAEQIADFAFFSCGNLKSVIIDGPSPIGKCAFEYCAVLESVTFNGGVTQIGDSAFCGCKSIKNLILPEQLTSIGEKAFYSCDSLKSIVIPDGVTTIGAGAFGSCDSLYALTLGRGVTKIESDAFALCYNLIEVCNLSSMNIQRGSVLHGRAGYYALNVFTPESGQSHVAVTDDYIFYADGEQAFLLAYIGSSKTVVLPEWYGGKSYKIKDYAFNKNSVVTRIEVPRGITEIGGYAFADCANLESVKVSSDVKKIGGYAFSNCVSLQKITMAEGVTEIGNYAFKNCKSLKNITIPDSVTKLNFAAFDLCENLESASLGEGLTEISSYLFKGCNNLKSVQIPSGVTKIRDGAFDGCVNLKEVKIPEGVTIIGQYAFRRCATVKNIVIPDSVTAIEEQAFLNCTALTSVTLGDELAYIGESAFNYCINLKSVYYTGGVDGWCVIRFEGLNSNPLKQGGELYIGNELVTDLVIPQGVEEIGDYAFINCGITSLTLCDGVEKIGASAFEGCKNLESVVINEGLYFIGEQAFKGCKNIQSVYYCGTEEQWEDADGIQTVFDKNLFYFYSETKPEGENFWHYNEDGQIEVWNKQSEADTEEEQLTRRG